MTPKKRYFEAVRLGDDLPAVAKAPVDRAQLVRYAARAQRLLSAAR